MRVHNGSVVVVHPLFEYCFPVLQNPLLHKIHVELCSLRVLQKRPLKPVRTCFFGYFARYYLLLSGVVVSYTLAVNRKNSTLFSKTTKWLLSNTGRSLCIRMPSVCKKMELVLCILYNLKVSISLEKQRDYSTKDDCPQCGSNVE